MALKFAQADAKGAVVAAARETLAELASVPDARGGAMPLAHQSVSDLPLPVYALGLERLAHGGTLEDAEAVAWRVFVVDRHDEPVGTAEVAPSGGGDPPHVLSYTEGEQVTSSGRALAAAAGPDEAGAYEPRFLEIPGISTSALWLKNVGGGEDRLVPIDPVPRFLRDKDAYSPAEFLELARPQAVERLTFDDRPALGR